MKNIVPLGVVIATRQLEFVFNSGRKEKVLVSIGAPVQSTDPECWLCPYQIEAPSFKKLESSAGMDSVQALDLTLGGMAAVLSYLGRQHDGEFNFLSEPGHEFRQST